MPSTMVYIVFTKEKRDRIGTEPGQVCTHALLRNQPETV